MSDLIHVSVIKDYLTECPVCKEQFDENSHLPRRMTCCVQCICHDCLQKIYQEPDGALLCPICRDKHHLPNGVTSLPREHLILKIINDLKIHKGLQLPCTDCPDSNEAVARCDDCCVFMCRECKASHDRHRLSRRHMTVTFEEMKGRPVQTFRRLHQCSLHQQPQQFYCYSCDKIICVSCTVLDHDKGKGHNVASVEEAHKDQAQYTDGILARLEEKVNELSTTEAELMKTLQTIKVSAEVAKQDIKNTFDDLIEKLQERRTILLSDVEEKSTKFSKITEEAFASTRTLRTKLASSTEYTKQMRGKADHIEDLQLMLSSAGSLNAMLEVSPKTVGFSRSGVTFVPGNLDHLFTTIKSTGLVRSVTFSPTRRPHCSYPATYNTIIIEPAESAEANDVGPTLAWDAKTASSGVTISGSIIRNTEPDSPQPDTGCRMQLGRHVLASRPLVVKRCHRDMFHVKVAFTVKQVKDENKMMFEIALTSIPVDGPCSQDAGLSVHGVTCSKHKQQLCLRVMYNAKPITDIPLCQNQSNESRDLSLCFLLDGTKGKIYIIDNDEASVMCTVHDAVFDRPLWVMMCVDTPSNSDIRGELISCQDVSVPDEMSRILSLLDPR